MDQKEPRLPPLSIDRKDYLFGCLLRLPPLFARAKNLLKVGDIDGIVDVPFLCLWQAAQTVANRNNGALPPVDEQARIQIELEVKELAQHDPETVTKDHFDYLFGPADQSTSGLITYSYTQPIEAYSELEGNRLLKRYLEELTLYKPVQQAASAWRHGLPESLDPFLERLQAKKAQIATLDQRGIVSAFPENVERKPIEIISTGVPFMDHLMAGGGSPGEVYVVLGPTGCGKTTLAVELAVEGALLQQRLNPSEPDKWGHWFDFSYESPVDPDIWNRVWSYCSRVEEESLYDLSKLSSREANNYKPYEHSVFNFYNCGAEGPPGEKERLNHSKELLCETNLWLADYSGTYASLGIGGITEIAMALDVEAKSGRKITGVVIDWAGQAVTRYMAANNIDTRQEFHFLRNYVDEVRMKIAARFNCMVWIFHQLHGECTRRKPGSTFHHSEALGCRNFADNAWFAFTLANPDPETSTTLIAKTKSRRGPPQEPQVVMFEGNIRRLSPADKQFALDSVQRKVVKKQYAERIVTPASIALRANRKVFDPVTK